MTFCPWERQSCTKKYDNLKLVNLVQTDEILLTENFTYLSIRFEIFGWICMYIYRQNLGLNDLQGLRCHKTQTTNQQSETAANRRVTLMSCVFVSLSLVDMFSKGCYWWENHMWSSHQLEWRSWSFCPEWPLLNWENFTLASRNPFF